MGGGGAPAGMVRRLGGAWLGRLQGMGGEDGEGERKRRLRRPFIANNGGRGSCKGRTGSNGHGRHGATRKRRRAQQHGAVPGHGRARRWAVACDRGSDNLHGC